MATLPHEREKNILDDIVDDCLKGRNKNVIVIANSHDEIHWFHKQITRIAESLDAKEARKIKIFRLGLEFDNGAKVAFLSKERPEYLRGHSPDRIVIMGRDAEFWYLITAMNCPIEAVA